MFAKNIFRISLCFLLLFVAVATSSCAVVNETMYPIGYEEYIVKYCDIYGVPYELLCAVIRTESSFDANAKSSAGAMGLMQLLPSTAEEIALRLKEEYNPDMLLDPETSIRYGCFYLSYLNRYLGGDWGTACAAYNAGIGRVKSWLEDDEYSDDGITLKKIPIKETENYVKRINEFKVKYKELYFTNEGEQ